MKGKIIWFYVHPWIQIPLCWFSKSNTKLNNSSKCLTFSNTFRCFFCVYSNSWKVLIFFLKLDNLSFYWWFLETYTIWFICILYSFCWIVYINTYLHLSVLFSKICRWRVLSIYHSLPSTSLTKRCFVLAFITTTFLTDGTMVVMVTPSEHTGLDIA